MQSTDAQAENILQQMQEQGCPMSCAQMQTLITMLQQQTNTVQAANAAVSAGGGVPPANPNWQPWPAHSWPNANNADSQAMQGAAQQVQSTDSTEIEDLWDKMHTAGC